MDRFTLPADLHKSKSIITNGIKINSFTESKPKRNKNSVVNMIVHKSLVKDDDEKASVQTTETVL